MAFDITDIFSALATGDPYAGRKMRLAEMTQQGNYDINNRQVNLMELMGPLERQALMQRTQFEKEMQPLSIKALEQKLSFWDQILSDAGDAEDSLTKAADKFSAAAKDLKGQTPVGAASKLAEMLGLTQPQFPASALGLEGSAGLPSFPGMRPPVAPLGANVQQAGAARFDEQGLAKNARVSALGPTLYGLLTADPGMAQTIASISPQGLTGQLSLLGLQNAPQMSAFAGETLKKLMDALRFRAKLENNPQQLWNELEANGWGRGRMF